MCGGHGERSGPFRRRLGPASARASPNMSDPTCRSATARSVRTMLVAAALLAGAVAGQDPARVAKDLADRRAEVRIHACEAARAARMSDARVVEALLRTKEDPNNAAAPVRDLAIKALTAAGPA